MSKAVDLRLRLHAAAGTTGTCRREKGKQAGFSLKCGRLTTKNLFQATLWSETSSIVRVNNEAIPLVKLPRLLRVFVDAAFAIYIS